MGRKKSLRSKAAHFVSDLTTVLLNPISDKTSSKSDAPHPDNVTVSKEGQLERVGEERLVEDNPEDFLDGPDTSSFTAFLYSLLSSSEPVDDSTAEDQTNADDRADRGEVSSDAAMMGPGSKKSLLSRGRQSLGIAFTKIVGSRSQDWRSNSDGKLNEDSNKDKFSGVELRNLMNSREPEAVISLPGISEPSLLLSEKTRSLLYASLPALVQGRKWLLLYSTWRHGISLSTLYRRSLLWPGLSLLVVGDRKGAIFGGLVEAPLRPTSKKYQGTNSTFVFTTTAGHPNIFRPTGANRYYTLCSTEFLAIGGGGHFAIYLDSDLLTGSSSSSETYGNPCLAHSQDFEVKEVELWGFVYASKYDEVLASSQTEEPGICRW